MRYRSTMKTMPYNINETLSIFNIENAQIQYFERIRTKNRFLFFLERTPASFASTLFAPSFSSAGRLWSGRNNLSKHDN